MSERGHVHTVFLPAEHYVGISKVQAELEIGKSAAILLMINEGLNCRGFIARDVYETFKARYERKLVEVIRRLDPRGLLKEQQKEHEKLKQMERLFSKVLNQWSLHPSKKWRDDWIRRAEEYQDRVPNAKLILALANGEPVEGEKAAKID